MVSYNWGLYLNKQPTPGQLLPYPLNVMPNGELKYLDGVSSFPDFPSSAKIMGKTNPLMPQKVTTWKKRLRCMLFINANLQFYSNTYIKGKYLISFLLTGKSLSEHLFWHQLTHNMTQICLLSSVHINSKVKTWCVQKLIFLCSFCQSEQFTYKTCSELGIFM